MGQNYFYEWERLAKQAKRAVFPPKDVNLPLEGAALRKKQLKDAQQRAQQKEAVGRLGDLMKGKNPITRK